MQGFGGTGTGTNQWGVSVEGVAGLISATSSILSVTGTGGEFSSTSGSNYGVYLTDHTTVSG